MASHGEADFKPHQLDNPLFHHYDKIDEAAEAFAISIGADRELCKKAARIASDPPTWESVDGLDEVEKKALRDEKKQTFRGQTKTLKVTIITLCFSAVVQGWIQSVSNGANQTMPEYFGLKHNLPIDLSLRPPRLEADYSWVNNGSAIWKFAGINAITYLTAGIFGCWFSDPLQSSVLGRRGAIFASACLCIAASIGAASVHDAHNWWQLLIWRGILGFGLGAKAAVTPIFGAEVAPTQIRGMLVMNWQLFDALGVFLGFSANLIFYWTGPLAWRFQIASACIPAFALVVLIWVIPESPRWLLKKGRGKEAFASLCALRPTPLQAAIELFFANAQIQKELEYLRRQDADPESTTVDDSASGSAESDRVTITRAEELGRFDHYAKEIAKTTYWGRILQLFRDDRTRRATLAAAVVMLGQQLCGVNVLAFYSTVFIQNINGQSTKNLDALWLSWGLGLANFLFTLPVYWMIDKYGRRFLLLATYPGMILSLLGATLSFCGGTDPEADTRRKVLVSLFMFSFIIFYSLGQGPVAFAYCSEVFPLFNREAGMSFAVFVNLVGAGLLTLFVPRAQVSVQTYTDRHDKPANPEKDWLNRQAGLMGAFVVLCTISMVLIYFFVPETNRATTREDGKRVLNYISLEELNHIFAVRTKDCINYYTRHVARGKIHNVLYRFGQRKKMVEIEQSMHFWVEDALHRRKKNIEDEGTESEKTEVSETHTEGGDREKRSAEVVHDESPTAPRDPDAISPALLPKLADTGGSIDFQPEQPPPSSPPSPRPSPAQPHPDSFDSTCTDRRSRGRR